MIFEHSNPQEIIQMAIEALSTQITECKKQGELEEIPPTVEWDNGQQVPAGVTIEGSERQKIFEIQDDLDTLQRLLNKKALSKHDIARVVVQYPDSEVANIILLPVRKAVKLPGGIPVSSWGSLLGEALRNGGHIDAEILSVKYG